MTQPDRTAFAVCFDREPPATDPERDLVRGRRARRTRTHRRIIGAAAALVVVAGLGVGLSPWGGEPQLAVPAGPGIPGADDVAGVRGGRGIRADG